MGVTCCGFGPGIRPGAPWGRDGRVGWDSCELVSILPIDNTGGWLAVSWGVLLTSFGCVVFYLDFVSKRFTACFYTVRANPEDAWPLGLFCAILRMIWSVLFSSHLSAFFFSWVCCLLLINFGRGGVGSVGTVCVWSLLSGGSAPVGSSLARSVFFVVRELTGWLVSVGGDVVDACLQVPLWVGRSGISWKLLYNNEPYWVSAVSRVDGGSGVGLLGEVRCGCGRGVLVH